jgi:hypothetical protein
MKKFLALLAQQAAKGQPESLQQQLAEGLKKALEEFDDLAMIKKDGLRLNFYIAEGLTLTGLELECMAECLQRFRFDMDAAGIKSDFLSAEQIEALLKRLDRNLGYHYAQDSK